MNAVELYDKTITAIKQLIDIYSGNEVRGIFCPLCFWLKHCDLCPNRVFMDKVDVCGARNRKFGNNMFTSKTDNRNNFVYWTEVLKFFEKEKKHIIRAMQSPGTPYERGCFLADTIREIDEKLFELSEK